jgi:hypothetical protein
MDEARLALIIAAILAFKPEDFTTKGAPKAASIKATGLDITPEELEAALAKIEADKPATEIATTIDTEGASYVVTHRDGGPKKVWFRNGKEIGVENV